MTNKSSTVFALRRLLGLPRKAAEFYRADNSGIALIPRKESTIAPEHRINFLIASNVKQYLAADQLDSFGQRYAAILETRLDSLKVGKDWETFPDLFDFIQRTTDVAVVEALCGTDLLRLCPDFIVDLMVLQANVPNLLRLHLRWLMRSAYRSRQRLLQAVKTWHAYALNHCKSPGVGRDDPDWEPCFGSKLVRARQQYTSKMNEMTPDAQASEDLGLIFAATSNISIAMFWMTYEVIKDPTLRAHLVSEISSCAVPGQQEFDILRLKEKPLIQSTYAEVLRCYIATLSSRVAEYSDIKVAGYNIPKDSFLIMSSRTMALDHQAWKQAGGNLTKPLEEFDAERFLVDAKWEAPKMNRPKHVPESPPLDDRSSQRRFTLDGLLGVWIPYGGGDHICPGRHLAKHQIILTLAALLSKFDLELSGKNFGDVRPNMRFAPFGALPPLGKIPFRLRKKAA